MRISAEISEDATLLKSPCTVQHQFIKPFTVFLSKRRRPFVRIRSNSVDSKLWYVYIALIKLIVDLLKNDKKK